MTITKEELAEWERVARAATEGPLTVYADGEVYADVDTYGIPESERVATFDEIDDARFYAAARTGWPEALDEVGRLRWRVVELEAELAKKLAAARELEGEG